MHYTLAPRASVVDCLVTTDRLDPVDFARFLDGLIIEGEHLTPQRVEANLRRVRHYFDQVGLSASGRMAIAEGALEVFIELANVPAAARVETLGRWAKAMGLNFDAVAYQPQPAERTRKIVDAIRCNTLTS